MKKLLFSLATVSMMWSCSGSKSSLSFAESTLSENSKLSAILWQQTAAEYDALCYQAFNLATNRVESMAMDQMASNSNKMAIVMDLDETVLDNSPFNGWLIHNNKTYTQENWTEWTSQASAAFVPGAVEFIEMATNQGFKIIYISNRTIEELEITISNLGKAGIVVSPSDVMLKTETSSKIDRRDKVLSSYEIFMLIGDNLADFNDQFDQDLNINRRKELTVKFRNEFGSKFIVLPNVMYGNWEKALKNNNSDYIQNNDAIGLKKYIKGF